MEPCSVYGEKLSAFHDGELAGREGDDIAAHLEACDACSERLAAYTEFDTPLRSPLAAPPVATEEWTRVWVSIESAIDAPAGDVDDWIDEKILRAGDAAARLVRRLIPMAAAACLLLGAYGYTVLSNQAQAAEAARAIDDGFGLDPIDLPAAPGEQQ